VDAPQTPDGRERIAFSNIADRPRLTLPDGARIAVWICPNFEHYDYLPGPIGVRDPWPRMPHPDILGYGGKDYGNRVGAWRLFEAMDTLGLRCTVSLGLDNFDRYPQMMEACEARGWDYLCHGLSNTRYLWGMGETEERDYIAACVASARRLLGRVPAGWFAPAVSYTTRTPDLVAEAGFRYTADFHHDDQPTEVAVRSGRLIGLPYAMELNDAILHQGPLEAADFARMIRDQFEVLYAEGADQPRIMGVAVHPYMMGQPHRLKHLVGALEHILGHSGVWMATGDQIADWYLKARP